MMFEYFQNSVEGTTSHIETFEQRIRSALRNLRRRLRLFVKRLLQRAAHAFRRFINRLQQLGKNVYRLVLAFSKVSLFYLPGVLGLLLGWDVFALIWFAAFTALGLFYRKRQPLRP